MSAQSLIKESIDSVFKKNIHIAPDIPEKQLNNALSKIAKAEEPNHVTALYDNSLLLDGNDGTIIFLGTKLYLRTKKASAVIVIKYDEIEEVRYVKKEVRKKRADGESKISYKDTISVTKADRSETEIQDLSYCDYEKFTDLLKQLSSIEEYTESNQMYIINEMDSQVKLSYLKVVINMAFSDDGEVDPKEYSEIISLMTRVGFSPEERIKLRTYIIDEEKESNESLLDTIKSKCPKGHEKSLRISLVKDLIIIFKATKNQKADECSFLQENRNIFDVSEEEIELIEQAIEIDIELIKGKLSDKDIKQKIKELLTKADSTGVTLGSLYMTGTAAFTASSIVSGFAVLGFGGFLGFTSMLTGIGIPILTGIMVYKVLKKVTGSKEIEQQKTRLFLLQESIRHTQNTINILVEDINYISVRLVKAIEDSESHSVQIMKLTKVLTLSSESGPILTQNSEYAEKQIYRIKCPEVLNLPRLESLTNEPTKKKYLDIVLGFYEETTPTDAKTKNDKKAYILKEDLSTKDTENLSEIFDLIGYFDAGVIAKGAAKGAAKSLKQKISKKTRRDE